MFDIKKTLEKAVRGAISGAIVALAALFAKNGATLDPSAIDGLTVGLTAIALGLLAGLTNWLKWKFPKIFSWL